VAATARGSEPLERDRVDEGDERRAGDPENEREDGPPDASLDREEEQERQRRGRAGCGGERARRAEPPVGRIAPERAGEEAGEAEDPEHDPDLGRREPAAEQVDREERQQRRLGGAEQDEEHPYAPDFGGPDAS